ncbi:MAG TPA: hypothetical protein PL033_12290 [Candidatus Brocadiia bacterium]|nr:hypothetical protein [Candidatus Brocadiia bacterium]
MISTGMGASGGATIAPADARRLRQDAWELSEDVAKAWGRRRSCVIRLQNHKAASLAGMVCVRQSGTVSCMATAIQSEIHEAEGAR